MSKVTTKLVTPIRLRQLLDCYGSSPSSWPADERQAALNLLKGSAELRALQDEVRSLDEMLSQTHALENNAVNKHAVHALQQRIMSQLPEQEPPAVDSNTEANEISGNSRRRPHQNRLWWGSIAASLFIVSLSIGVIHQLNGPNHEPIADQMPVVQKSDDAENQVFAQWAWEDITGELLTGDSDNDPSTLLALVELELPAE